MGNIKIITGVFDIKLELEHAGIKAGFPSPADDYRHETLDFNRDYIRHPEASFYGDVEGDSMRDAGLLDGDRVIIDRAGVTPCLAPRDQATTTNATIIRILFIIFCKSMKKNPFVQIIVCKTWLKALS